MKQHSQDATTPETDGTILRRLHDWMQHAGDAMAPIRKGVRLAMTVVITALWGGIVSLILVLVCDSHFCPSSLVSGMWWIAGGAALGAVIGVVICVRYGGISGCLGCWFPGVNF